MGLWRSVLPVALNRRSRKNICEGKKKNEEREREKERKRRMYEVIYQGQSVLHFLLLSFCTFPFLQCIGTCVNSPPQHALWSHFEKKKKWKRKITIFFPSLLLPLLLLGVESLCAFHEECRERNRERERERERERGRPQTHFPLHCLAESAALFALFALFTFALKNTFQAIFARRDSCICWHLIRCYSPSPPPP